MKNNPFAVHGIDHLSPSTINFFIRDPAKCLMKFAGYPGDPSPAMWRGKAIERAVEHGIRDRDKTVSELIEIGLEEFDLLVTEAIGGGLKVNSDRATKERQCVESSVVAASQSYIPSCPELVDSQVRMEFEAFDLPVPFLMFYDFMFENEVVDLKTKTQRQSKPDSGDSRQVSLYGLATGKEPWLVYTSPKEVRQFMVVNNEQHLRDLEAACRSLMRLLSFSDDIKEICQALFPNFDSFMWGDRDKINATKIWEINYD
jgi:hypothetical protein